MTAGELAVFVAITAQNVVSIVLSCFYFFGIPFLLAGAARTRVLASDGPLLLIGGFWILGVGWHLMYCEALYTTRYMGPVLPFMALGALFASARLLERYRPAVGWPIAGRAARNRMPIKIDRP
jgi:hypothetical protein